MKISKIISVAALTIGIWVLLLVSCYSPFGPYDEGGGQAPRELTARFLGSAVDLSWAATPESEESAYIVYRSEGDTSHYREIARITGWVTRYRDTGVEIGKQYFYKVKTEYNGDPGTDSNEVTVSIAPYMLWFTVYTGSPRIGVVFAYNPLDYTINNISDIWELGDKGITIPYGITCDDEYIYLSEVEGSVNYTTYLYKLDRANGKVVSSYGPPTEYYRLTFDGTYLWTVYWGDPLLKIDPETGLIVDEVHTSRFIYSGITSDGSYIWGTREYIEHTDLYKLDPSNGDLLDTLKVDLEKPGLAWDGTYLWGVHTSVITEDTAIDFRRINPADGSTVDDLTIRIDEIASVGDMEIVPTIILGDN